VGLTALPALALALVAAAPAAGPPPGEHTILRAAAAVDLSRTPRAPTVLVEIELPAGGGRMPFRILQSAGAMAGLPLATAGGRQLGLALSRLDEDAIEGTVDLPPATGSPVRLTLRYEVSQRGPEGRYRLPLPVPEWPPGPDAGDTFTATVRVPAGVTMRDPFPSRAARRADTAGAVYSFALPAVPSRLAFDLRPDARGPSVGLLIDVAVAVLLAALALYGWRRLRRELA